MRGVWKLALLLALAASIAAVLGACGGDSDDSTSSSGIATSNRETPRSVEDRGADDSSSSSGEESASFRTPGGDNSIQNFGEEADASEVDAATAVLGDFLDARAKDDWAGQCANLAKAAVAPLEELASRSSQLKGKDCAAILAALTGSASASTRTDPMTAGIASLRVEGDRGFALFHGAGGVDYFVPMAKEDGEWMVGAVAPSEFP